MPHLF